MMRLVLLYLCLLIGGQATLAQGNFVDWQKSFPRVMNAIKLKEDTLKKQFEKSELAWPPQQLYIRSFKYDSQLEVWVRNSENTPFKLFKTYKVCAMAGQLGPKRIEGDYQVPEGFYYINEFNPRSSFHLSLGINYPNASDKLLSDSAKPGGDIYIHGSCITTGCIPITDVQMEELYILAMHAKNAGQDFIPVHIFPIRYNNPKSIAYLTKTIDGDTELQQFANRLKKAYDYFEQHQQLPTIVVNKLGQYIVVGK